MTATVQLEYGGGGAPIGLSKFQVCIACANHDTGLRARGMFERLGRIMDGDVQFYYELWRFDTLEFPELRRTATRQAGVADIIVVAPDGEGELPPGLRDWIEDWLTQRGGRLGALVAVFEEDAAGQARSAACAYLRHVAQRGGLEFFCSAAHPEFTVDSITQRSEQTSWVLQEILHRPHAPAHWGINE